MLPVLSPLLLLLLLLTAGCCLLVPVLGGALTGGFNTALPVVLLLQRARLPDLGLSVPPLPPGGFGCLPSTGCCEEGFALVITAV